MQEIDSKSDGINRSIVTITNANNSIKTEVARSVDKISQLGAIRSKERKKLE